MSGNSLRRAVFSTFLFLLTSQHASAQTGTGFDQDVLSPAEREELELRRERERPPVLACRPRELRARLKRGSRVTRSLYIQNAGGRTLNWLISKAPAWVSVRERSGALGFREKRTVDVTIDPGMANGGQEADRLRGRIVIAASGAEGSPASIPIQVEILAKARPARPARPVETPSRAPVARAPKSFGVRGGVLLPGAGERVEYANGFAVGVFWRPAPRSSRQSRVGYEVEVSLGRAESVSGLATSSVLAGRAAALWHFFQSEGVSAYAVGGASLAREEIDDEQFGRGESTGASFELAAGATFAGRWDARLTYSMLLGSDNVADALTASIGVMF